MTYEDVTPCPPYEPNKITRSALAAVPSLTATCSISWKLIMIKYSSRISRLLER